MKTIDISINFNINDTETNANDSTNINFHVSDDELSVEEYVTYMKRAGLAFGFSEADMALITVEE